MICFFCATPYHIMLSIIIKENHFKAQSADIVIYNHFHGAKNLYEKILDTGIFKNVYFFNENNSSIKNRFKRIYHSIFPQKVIQRIANNSHYSEMIFFALDFLNISYIIKRYHRSHKKCIFSYGEDGMGTYMEPIYVPNKYLRLFLKITRRKQFLKKIKTLYVLVPHLLQCNNFKNIKQIGTAKNNEILTFCKQTLWSEGIGIQLKRVVYMQEPFYNDFSLNIDYIEHQILDICNKIFQNDFLIKLHPITQKFKYSSASILRMNIPFELLLTESKPDSLIIISFLSTAAITPGFLFGHTPYLIFTYELLADKCPFINTEVTAFITELKKLKTCHERIFIPKTIEELKTILLELHQKTNN